MKTRFCGAVAWLIAEAALEGSAYAQATLDTVTVIGVKLEEELPQELSRTGVRVDTISSGELKNGGYPDVATALQSLAPGLYVSPKNGPFDYVDLSYQGSRTS